MKGELHRLVYVSRNAVAGDATKVSATVEEILRVSRHRNSRAGLTGALMLDGTRFAQVLEGPHTPLAETFERIRRDDRHSDVEVLEFCPVACRSFPDWSMAYAPPSDLTAPLLPLTPTAILDRLVKAVIGGHATIS